jgi:hypothetical protein
MNSISQETTNYWAVKVAYGAYNDFCPDHGTGVAFNVEAPKYFLDDVETDISAVNTLEWFVCSDFKLVQNVNLHCDGVDIANVKITHHIDKTGVLSYSANLTALQNLYVDVFLPFNVTCKSSLDY